MTDLVNQGKDGCKGDRKHQTRQEVAPHSQRELEQLAGLPLNWGSIQRPGGVLRPNTSASGAPVPADPDQQGRRPPIQRLVRAPENASECPAAHAVP